VTVFSPLPCPPSLSHLFSFSEKAKPLSLRVLSSSILTDTDMFPASDSIFIKWRPVAVNQVTQTTGDRLVSIPSPLFYDQR
jgi:hypothetical protein